MGNLNKDGVVSDLEIVDVPNGVVSDSDLDGDVSIQAVDVEGHVISSVVIKPDFYRISPNVTTEIDTIPFAVQLLVGF